MIQYIAPMSLIIPSPLVVLYISTLIVGHLSFWYSSIKIFRAEKQKQTLKKFIFKTVTVVVWYLSLLEILFFTGVAHPGLVWFGIVVNVFSLILFWISARQIGRQQFTAIYSLDQPGFHIKDGPYSYVRHPFYTAYILYYSALLFVVPSPLLAGFIISLITMYYLAARDEESKFIQSELAAEYKKYQSKTGMFFPKKIY